MYTVKVMFNGNLEKLETTSLQLAVITACQLSNSAHTPKTEVWAAEEIVAIYINGCWSKKR